MKVDMRKFIWMLVMVRIDGASIYLEHLVEINSPEYNRNESSIERKKVLIQSH